MENNKAVKNLKADNKNMMASYADKSKQLDDATKAMDGLQE